MSDSRVLVVGAGPAGLACALGLARRGIPVTVFEREADLFRAPRAMGYHWSALYGLDDLGVLDEMVQRGFLTRGLDMRVLATGEVVPFHVDPLVGRVAHPYSLTLGQDLVGEILVEHLLAHPHAEIRWQTTVESLVQDDDSVTVTLGSGEQVRGDFLIAADGATSAIRTAVGLGFGGLTWPHNFIAVNVSHDLAASRGLGDNNYLIDPRLGSVVARVTSDALWRVTWSEAAALPEESAPERIDAFLTELLPAGQKWELVSWSRYRMHQRASESMRAGRVVLAGDAAHATNPTSGFGLVGGLHDSYVLVDALGAILTGRASIDVLDRYSEDRLSAFWTVSSPMSTESKRLVFHSDDPDRLEIDLQLLRRISADPVRLLNHWLNGARVESPSVVTGEYLSRGRNTPS